MKPISHFHQSISYITQATWSGKRKLVIYSRFSTGTILCLYPETFVIEYNMAKIIYIGSFELKVKSMIKICVIDF